MPIPTGTKKAAYRLLHDLAKGAAVSEIYHVDATWFGSHPFGTLYGLRAIEGIWADLRHALPDMERRDLIFLGGENQDDPRLSEWRAPHMIAAIGHIQGTFCSDLLGIPATHGTVHLRYAEGHFVEDGRIRQSRVMFDLLDLMRQAGVWPLPQSLGAEGMWPGPAPQNGLRIEDRPRPEDASDSLDVVFKMHDALLSFDGENLDSMQHADFWTKDFMYFAGGGIGSMRGMEGFRAHHQIPFLRAFPDRGGRGHFIRIADGPFAVTGGNVFATHTGEIFGIGGTGKVIEMPVMDFYRLDDTGRIAENWLPIDVLGMAYQMGVDLLARVQHYQGRPRRTL